MKCCKHKNIMTLSTEGKNTYALNEAKKLSNALRCSGGIRKKTCGPAKTDSKEPPFKVHCLPAAPSLGKYTVLEKATDPVKATEVPATHRVSMVPRVSCISVECVAGSCAMRYAEMEDNAPYFTKHF